MNIDISYQFHVILVSAIGRQVASHQVSFLDLDIGHALVLGNATASDLESPLLPFDLLSRLELSHIDDVFHLSLTRSRSVESAPHLSPGVQSPGVVSGHQVSPLEGVTSSRN